MYLSHLEQVFIVGHQNGEGVVYRHQANDMSLLSLHTVNIPVINSVTMSGTYLLIGGHFANPT